MTTHWNGPAGRNGPCDLKDGQAPGRPFNADPLCRMNLTACPICGFPLAGPVDETELSASYSICGCCGCEYGYDDTQEYRAEWLAKGAPWFAATKPPDWKAEDQLKRAIPEWVN